MKKFIVMLSFFFLLSVPVFGFDSDYSWIYTHSIDSDYQERYDILISNPYFLYFKISSDSNVYYYYLSSSDPIDTVFFEGKDIIFSPGSIYQISSYKNTVGRSIGARFVSSGIEIISSNSMIYNRDTGDVFFSPPRHLLEMTEDLAKVTVKQAGGIVYGVIWLISIPILLVLLVRLYRRYSTL